ncbi:MFS transporter [Streptomyces sp. R302]|uniref:MFS transporter n=1 Tax=unclassified Streptomyces TaxID=2593676 RepID=UPI00145DE84E|nr:MULTISPECIES: MFS transporter [unclassified Streptomyces]NML51330.1 MFS transporter [Streptomyces sp. R301]NML79908.1 MFS transporter [Streptomyces sp. R302]
MATSPQTTAPHSGASSGSGFWYFWAASGISSLGSGITAIALPLTALVVLDASAFEVGIITAASYAGAVLIGLPAGVIVQRFPMRGLQVAMDLIRAALIASVPVAAWLHMLTLTQLVLVGLFISLANILFDVANTSFLPALVSKEELTARNSLLSGTLATTQLAGPSLGGLLVQMLGAATSLLTDAVSYLLSAVFLWRIPGKGSRLPARSHEPFTEQIKAGVRFVLRHPVIRPCVLASTAFNLSSGALLAIAPVFLVRTAGLSAGTVGLVLACDGVGALAGAAVTTRLAATIGSARASLAATAVGAVITLCMPLAHSSWTAVCFGLGQAGFAAGITAFSILTRTHRQSVTPPDLLPRVVASVRFFTWGAIPIGALLGGSSAEAFGARNALFAGCAVAFLAPLALFLSKVRHTRDLTD